jgi:hypothetical protein
VKRWDEDSDLWLFTMAEFQQLPDGIVLESINGKKAVKGLDRIGHERLWSYISWGVRDPYNHELAPLFTKFMLETK